MRMVPRWGNAEVIIDVLVLPPARPSLPPGELEAFLSRSSFTAPAPRTVSLGIRFLPAALHRNGLGWEAAQNALEGAAAAAAAAAATSGNQLSSYSVHALSQRHSRVHADFVVYEIPKENNTLSKLSLYFIVQWLRIDNKFCSDVTLVSEEFPFFLLSLSWNQIITIKKKVFFLWTLWREQWYVPEEYFNLFKLLLGWVYTI